MTARIVVCAGCGQERDVLFCVIRIVGGDGEFKRSARRFECCDCALKAQGRDAVLTTQGAKPG